MILRRFLGLLINELVTNAMKYAPPQKAGDVCLTISAFDQGNRRMELRDHGPGLPKGLDAQKSSSLGMKLIARLSRQLGESLNGKTPIPAPDSS
jgi:two-component sensor histidine kinase